MPITTPASVCTIVRVASGASDDKLARCELGQAEVEHLHEAVAPDDDVLGLQVAMHDPERVRRADPGGNLDRDVERLPQRRRLRLQEVPQRVALDVFHRDERLTGGGLTERVDDADVGMVERGGRARFLLEASRARVVGAEVAGEDLDRDLASELEVAGEIDDAHAAGAELPADLVATELRSRGEGHWGCGDYMRALRVDGAMKIAPYSYGPASG